MIYFSSREMGATKTVTCVRLVRTKWHDLSISCDVFVCVCAEGSIDDERTRQTRDIAMRVNNEMR